MTAVLLESTVKRETPICPVLPMRGDSVTRSWSMWGKCFVFVLLVHPDVFFLNLFMFSSGVQWELAFQELVSLPGPSQRSWALGQCVAGEQPLQTTAYWPGNVEMRQILLLQKKRQPATSLAVHVFALRWCRQPSQKPRTQRRSQSQSRPSWLLTCPMSSLSCWRRLCWTILSSVSTGAWC